MYEGCVIRGLFESLSDNHMVPSLLKVSVVYWYSLEILFVLLNVTELYIELGVHRFSKKKNQY